MKKVKDFYFGIQFSIFADRQGFKIAYKLRLFRFYKEKVFLLKKNPLWGEGNPELTPKYPDPEIFAPKPTGKVIEPEDLCNAGI